MRGLSFRYFHIENDLTEKLSEEIVKERQWSSTQFGKRGGFSALGMFFLLLVQQSLLILNVFLM